MSRPITWGAVTLAGSLLAVLLPIRGFAADAGATTHGAVGGCGTKITEPIGPHGVFEGVVAVPKAGTTPSQVLHSIPYNTVAPWCASRVFVHPAGEPHPGAAIVQFLAKASPADVQRAARYLRGTGLFKTVTIVPHPKDY